MVYANPGLSGASESHPNPLVTEQPRREEGDVNAEEAFLGEDHCGSLPGNPYNFQRQPQLQQVQDQGSHSGMSGAVADCWLR